MAGENEEYVQKLARMNVALPAIVVRKATMRVVDGMHRLRAAELRGLREIEVRFFEGSDEDAFVFAVEANIANGLPLSLADRRFAAERVIASHPLRSDRWIASLTGLTAKTIGAIRLRSTEENPQSNTRIGRDGRARPVDAERRRRLAEKLLRDSPDLSVRAVAREAGIAPSTALNVRNRMRAAQLDSRLPDLDVRSSSPPAPEPQGEDPDDPAPMNAAVILDRLRSDPSLRFKEAGRLLIRGLSMRTLDPEELRPLLDGLPAHCAEAIVELARYNSAAWQQLGEQLERR